MKIFENFFFKSHQKKKIVDFLAQNVLARAAVAGHFYNFARPPPPPSKHPGAAPEVNWFLMKTMIGTFHVKTERLHICRRDVCTFVVDCIFYRFAHLWAKCLYKCGCLHICGWNVLHICGRDVCTFVGEMFAQMWAFAQNVGEMFCTFVGEMFAQNVGVCTFVGFCTFHGATRWLYVTGMDRLH